MPKGTSVTINMTSSAAEDYRLHGYDLEQKADAGKTSTFEFTADQTGQFDLESHLTEKTLLVLVVVSARRRLRPRSTSPASFSMDMLQPQLVVRQRHGRGQVLVHGRPDRCRPPRPRSV